MQRRSTRSRFSLMTVAVALGCATPPPRVVAVAVPPAASSAEAQVTAEPKNRDPERALDLANQGDRAVTTDVASALEKYREALEFDNENPLLYWKLGHAYGRQEDFARFAHAMEAAAALAPHEARYWDRLAFTRRRLAEAGATAEWPRVLDAARTCLDIEPGRHECEHSAGSAKAALGDWVAAKQHYLNALAADTDNGDYHVTLVEFFVERRQFAEAEQALTTAERDVPMVQLWKEQLYRLRLLSVQVARVQGDFVTALQAAENANAIAGDTHPEAAFELGKAHADVSPPNTEKAARLFRQFVKRVCLGALRGHFEAECQHAEQRLATTP